MEYRDRATGWKHAKISGHENEALVKELLDTNPTYANQFLERIGHSGDELIATSIGGLHETNVPSVTSNRKTKSKTDLKVYLKSGKTVNVSVKKSLSGQVYFVRAGIFIDTFEKQFGKRVPNSVQRAINLFWAAADDAIEIIEGYADPFNKKDYTLQLRHQSLNATTLMTYSKKLYDDLLVWFVENAYEIAKLSFSMGSVRDNDEWSDFIWYKNMLEENNIDEVFLIENICTAVKNAAECETYYGSKNGGSTIQLPFGFVQWHQRKLQFHHDYDKLVDLLR